MVAIDVLTAVEKGEGLEQAMEAGAQECMYYTQDRHTSHHFTTIHNVVSCHITSHQLQQVDLTLRIAAVRRSGR